jgi:hypothetical protein
LAFLNHDHHWNIAAVFNGDSRYCRQHVHSIGKRFGSAAINGVSGVALSHHWHIAAICVGRSRHFWTESGQYAKRVKQAHRAPLVEGGALQQRYHCNSRSCNSRPRTHML